MIRPSSRFGRILPAVVLLLSGIALAAGISLIAPRLEGLPARLTSIDDTTAFDQPPIYAGEMTLGSGQSPRRPGPLFFADGKYYVTYERSGTVDIFDRRFEVVASIQVTHGGEASIAGIAADDQSVYVADARSGEIRIHAPDGSLKNAFSWLPGKAARLTPGGIALYEQNLYVADPGNRQLLAISVSDVPGIKEEGELLFAAPGPAGDSSLLSTPMSAAVTPDGRILVSDAGAGNIKAFTCNGRFAYVIEPRGDGSMGTPGQIAFDGQPSPALLARNLRSFDPSGIRSQGRIHVIDRERKDIVVLDPTGNFVLRYGGGRLKDPVGIAIDRERRSIIVADAGIGGLVGFKY